MEDGRVAVFNNRRAVIVSEPGGRVLQRVAVLDDDCCYDGSIVFEGHDQHDCGV